MYFHIYLYADFILPLAASDICPLTPETKVLTFLLTYNHSADIFQFPYKRDIIL